MKGLLYLLKTDTWEVDKTGAALNVPVVKGNPRRLFEDALSYEQRLIAVSV